MTGRRPRVVSVAAFVAMAVAIAASGGQPSAGRIVGDVSMHVVTLGESWRSLAARFGVDAGVIAADNASDIDDLLSVGESVRIDNRHLVPAGIGRRSILVNLPQRMLFFADSANHVTGLPIAAGRATWRTPVGAFAVETKERNPTWEVPVSIREEARREGKSLPAVVPPGPDNPLGRFWLGLSIPNVGIHGTNAPLSIYRLATHGCVRLHPDDIEWLFNRVEVGWPGEIVYEPVLLAAVGNEVFVEAHPDVYRRVGGDARQQVRARAAMLGLGARIDWTLVDAEIERRSGIARLVSRLASSD